MTIQKSLICTIGIAATLLVTSFTHAQQESLSCEQLVFSIQGSEVALPETEHEYSMSVSVLDNSLDALNTGIVTITPNEIINDTRIQRDMLANNRVLRRWATPTLSYTYSALGKYTLRATVRYGSCSYQIEKSIDVYNQVYTYIGPFIDDFNYGVLNNIKDTQKLFHTYIPVEDTTRTTNSFVQNSVQQWNYIRTSSDIFRGIQNYALLFDVLQNLQNNYEIDIASKHIFIVDNTNKAIVKKFLARFIQEFDAPNIYVINNAELSDMLLNISIGKPAYTPEFLEDSHISFDSRVRISLGHVVDYLLFHGFPLQTLVLILSIIFAIMIIVFIKQIIGLSSFGVYYPLLFGFALHTVGLKTSIALLLLAIAAKITVSVISRKFTLLATAKIGLQIIAYCLYTIFALALYKLLSTQTVEFSIFANPMMLLAFLAILLVGAKIVTSTTVSGIRKQVLPIIRFAILSTITFLILTASRLHNLLLINPTVVVVGIITIILMGRYTGLQLIEYFRFRPLMKYLQQKNKN